MPTPEELLSQADIEGIAREGSKIYEEIKERYSSNKGQFLAIDIGSRKAYLGGTSNEAVEQARLNHPDQVFYVVKIGYSSAEALAHMDEYDYGLHPV